MTNPFGDAVATASTPSEVKADPFGGKDPFGSATSTFFGAKDCVGRLVLVWPKELIKDLKGQRGLYDAVTCDVAVIDGAPEPTYYPVVPARLPQVRLSGSALVPQLTPYLPGKQELNMTLGRMITYKPQNGGQDGHKLEPPTDADKDKARAYLASVMLPR